MIKFYYHPSPNPAKVALFLEESGLAYELVPVDTRKGEQHEPAFLKINPNANPEHVCLLGCGVTTGLGAVKHTAKVQAGDSVAVFGLGGIGLAVLQGAKLAGAGRIIAIDTNPSKFELARQQSVRTPHAGSLASHR